jgi:hypothetical protein
MVSMMHAAAIFILMGMPFAHGFAAGEGLKVTPGQFDFGTVDEGKAAVVTVTVENAGSTRIEITNVRTS